MNTQPAQTTLCPICHQSVPLDDSGRLTKHTTTAFCHSNHWPVCPASGTFPQQPTSEPAQPICTCKKSSPQTSLSCPAHKPAYLRDFQKFNQPQPERSEEKSRTGRWSDKRCPRCGSTLLTNDFDEYWCSYVGGEGSPGCTYGIDKLTPSPDVPPVAVAPTDPRFVLFDTDLPPIRRTQANYWKALWLNQQLELIKANKGIRRLKAKIARLIETK